MEERGPMVRPNTHSRAKNAAMSATISLDMPDEEQVYLVQNRRALPRGNIERELVPKEELLGTQDKDLEMK